MTSAACTDPPGGSPCSLSIWANCWSMPWCFVPFSSFRASPNPASVKPHHIAWATFPVSELTALLSSSGLSFQWCSHSTGTISIHLEMMCLPMESLRSMELPTHLRSAGLGPIDWVSIATLALLEPGWTAEALPYPGFWALLRISFWSAYFTSCPIALIIKSFPLRKSSLPPSSCLRSLLALKPNCSLPTSAHQISCSSTPMLFHFHFQGNLSSLQAGCLQAAVFTGA